MRGAASILAALALMACAPRQPEAPDSAPAPSAAQEDRVVGTLSVVGSTPVNDRVVLQPGEGGSIQLVGPLSEELRQLSGAQVALRGPMEPAPDPLADRQIRVVDYEILAVDGEPVISGTVEGRSGDWLLLRTSSGELVYLAGATAELRPGQKVWVQGPRGLIVQSFGVLRK